MIYAITRISPQAITPYNLDYSLPYITYRFPQLAVKKKKNYYGYGYKQRNHYVEQSQTLRCTEALSDVRFPLRNWNRNWNLVEACGISLPKRF